VIVLDNQSHQIYFYFVFVIMCDHQDQLLIKPRAEHLGNPFVVGSQSYTCCIGENRGPRVKGHLSREPRSLELLFMNYITCYNPG
jgi:hypothetical protein